MAHRGGDRHDPGLAIVVAVLGLSLLSDAIGDVLNPFRASRRSDDVGAAADPAVALAEAMPSVASRPTPR